MAGTSTTIHATGVTLILRGTERAGRWCSVHCHGVTWDGGTLRLAQPSFTQGRVTGDGSNPTGRGYYYDWKVDAGYVHTMGNPARHSTFDVVDQKTRAAQGRHG